jgi:outer membrane immunogenic protein
MKRFLLTSIAVIAFAGSPVLAADMALKAPAYAPAFSWTGCYGGFNGGGAWNSTSYDIGHNIPAADPDFFNGAFASGATPSHYNMNMNGGIVGIQAGCNYQTGAFVFGVEGDADWANLKGRQTINTAVGGFVPGSGVVTESLQSIATIRGRVGYAFDHLLLYGTGGLALGNTNDFYRFTFPLTNETYLATSSTNRTGWTAGAGAEYAFGYNWSVKLEGLWYDLHGSIFEAGGTTAASPPGAAHVVTMNSDTGWTLKAGLNYKVW